MRMMKYAAVLITAILLTGVASASVGFTETDEIPDEFAGGDTFTINTTVVNDGDEPLPAMFHLNVSSEYDLPREAFTFEVKSTSLPSPISLEGQDEEIPVPLIDGGEPVGLFDPCLLGEVFDRYLCTFDNVPEGEHYVEFEVSTAITLPPGNYSMQLDMMSLSGDMDLYNLFAYWEAPEEIPAGETGTVTSTEGNVEVSLTNTSDVATENMSVHVGELNELHPEAPEGTRFVRGAQVLAMEDVAQRSGIENITLEDIVALGEGDIEQPEQTGSGIDISLVIDSSGSMGWGNNPIDDAKAGAKNFVDNLKTDRGDKVAIVDFDSDANTVQPLTDDKAAAKVAIDLLYAGGGTDHDDAVYGGIDSLENGENSRQVMILLGDGCDATSTQPGEDARAKGIEIHTIVYGEGACPDDFEPILGDGAECETNEQENSDGDNCWYAETENVLDIFTQVQGQIDPSYLRDATEDSLFGGSTGQVDAKGNITIRFSGSEAAGLNRNTMGLYYYNNSVFNASANNWEKVADWNGGNDVTAQVDHFSVYAVFAEPVPPSNANNDQQASSGGSGPIPYPSSSSEINDTDDSETDTGDSEDETGSGGSEVPIDETGDDTEGDTGDDGEEGTTGDSQTPPGPGDNQDGDGPGASGNTPGITGAISQNPGATGVGILAVLGLLLAGLQAKGYVDILAALRELIAR